MEVIVLFGGPAFDAPHFRTAHDLAEAVVEDGVAKVLLLESHVLIARSFGVSSFLSHTEGRDRKRNSRLHTFVAFEQNFLRCSHAIMQRFASAKQKTKSFQKSRHNKVDEKSFCHLLMLMRRVV